MNIWKGKPVNAVQENVMSRWRILEANGARYAVGWNETEHEGRVSSAIMSYQKDRRILVTSSGRGYRLLGEPGLDPDGAYVWNCIAAGSGIRAWQDVTTEYLPDLPGRADS